ncbi:YceI family protein [Ferruginibacter paludis]|uniref:YceI family protein n=1 Tax=Ferruginibacter paludis TaxID=1310417 RepID=UPI0025B3A199|nr:YceI family protein [Ferruginibacter paludis]MDN3657867.1 YceI family protein [Ferruginibacter paludis]
MKSAMQKIAVVLIAFFFCIQSSAQIFLPVDAESSVKFSIKNFGLTTAGHFAGLKGKIQFDAGNTTSASFVVSVDAASVNTDNNTRDKHLLKEDYFDVAKYPLINFTSTSVNKDAAGKFLVTGNLSIKGVTKQISFPFTAEVQNNGYRFSGSFIINRRNFGVGGNSMVLADNLQVSLDVFAKKD